MKIGFQKFSMVGRFNAKSTVRSYYRSNNNFRSDMNARSMRDKLLHVRDLPKTCRHGMAMYKAATKNIENKLATNGESWINSYDHFKELDNVKFNAVSIASIESYLQKIEKHYQMEEKKSNESLNMKIEKLDVQWTKKYGYVPDVKKEKTEESAKYGLELKTVKREHYPTIYCNPGTSNFEYLCNSIKLMASKQTICFSFDIEAYEKDNNVITEVGISIFDPRENTGSIVPITRNFHIIISESLSLRNENWVCDLKECYLLGQSLVLNLNQCVEFVQSLINYYMIPKTEASKSWSRAYVGHNIDGDIRWLTKIGVNIPHLEQLNYSLDIRKQPNIPYVLDTMKFYRYCYGQNGSSLGKILRLFGLSHAFLHNAGNDAHYTLKLLMHMCDINFRIQFGLDDINKFERRAQDYMDRTKTEPKVLPMTYGATIKHINVVNKPKKDLVPQTEFGGSKWFHDAHSAFESTIEYTGKLF